MAPPRAVFARREKIIMGPVPKFVATFEPRRPRFQRYVFSWRSFVEMLILNMLATVTVAGWVRVPPPGGLPLEAARRHGLGGNRGWAFQITANNKIA